jgi:hypothetical protein
MKKKTLFFFLLLSVSAFSKSPIIYFIGTDAIAFEKVGDELVSKKCANKKCEAYKNALKFKKTELNPEWLVGGKNPKSVKCSRVLGGEVLIAEDIKGNQQSVCRFKDNSFLL